ncbi:YciI family protein [Plantactinospora sp. GCM10030261]|uniref:YciI family protein n=1 Tax=Plantactinospora sp. GCM10030261 TaxID=3273420 RepID=UPI0036241208
MRYLTLLKGIRADTPPPDGLFQAIMNLGEEATRAGALLDQGGLAPSAAGARVRVAGGELTTTDGPFAEAKEMLSYAIYQVRSREEAVEWASRFMRLHRDMWPGWEGDVEVLRVMGPEDFGGDAPTG